ncbi:MULTISPECIES: hypothetical protein [unclassified Novosphingobium]|uniref:hypothetical protein n=1 Tax=unclassified Novosphingobium TaxID=2644732 RepID=UPI0025FD46CF|nr:MULTISPECIES: hypothetical protein [unclassified Novosphingobium]HQV05001.1 hypothetical protein [Novosphingobium sp.]
MTYNREDQIETYQNLRRQERSGYGRWILLIKELRVTHYASILEAERLAFANPHRRRWIMRAINSNQICRKHALAHIRHNGESSLIIHDGESFRFDVR